MMKVGYRPPLDEYHPTKIAAANIFCQLGLLHFKIDSRYSIPSGLFIQFLGRGQLHSREIEHVSLIARNPSKYLFPMIRLLDLILFPFSPKMFAGEAEFYCTKASDLSQSDSPASTPE